MTRSKKTRKKPNHSYAGKAIGAGGFGCIFKPHLKCKTVKYKKYHEGSNKYVSKLMIKKYVKTEMSLIKEVFKNVKTIPNYKNYFLIDGVYSCIPDALTKKDLVGFNKKCTNLKRKHITRKNINKKLSDVKVINLPYGGIDIDEYWSKWNKMPSSANKNKSFAITNICLLQLLMKGILKMNLLKYYHFDIKGSNIMRTIYPTIKSTSSIKTRLIDWGLALKYTNTKKIPSEIMDRPLQYNLPFSHILFQSDIQKVIDNYVNNFKGTYHNYGKQLILKGLSEHIYKTSIHKIGSGHNDYIIELLENIYGPLYKDKENIAINIITEYISVILEKYTDDNYLFKSNDYFKNVFVKNADIWGFLMSYIDLITLKNPWKNKFQSIIVKVLTEYCFGTIYAARFIPIYPLVNELLTLNIVLKQPLQFKGYPSFTNKYRSNSIAI